MKHLTLGVAVFIVLLGTFLAFMHFNAEQPEITPIVSKVSSFESTPIFQSPAGVVGNTSDSEALDFADFSQSDDGLKIVFSGNLAGDNKEGAAISIYCNNKLAATAVTGADGDFTAKAQARDCKTGDDAYAKAGKGDESAESAHLTIRGLVTFGSSSHSLLSSRSTSGMQTTGTGVPEFSTMTLGAAVALTLIGVVYLRRK